MGRLATFPSQEIKVIGLISFGHMMSHFFFFVMPPLFLSLKQDFDVSYAVLALPMAAYALAAGVTQTPMGFLIDRIGARKLLILGSGIQGLSVAAIGFTDTFWQLLVLYTITGIANTVFHPADYGILSGSIAKERLGRAYSVHLFSGNFGWVLVPGVMIGLTELWGWRMAFIIVGMVGFAFALVVWTMSGSLSEEVSENDKATRKFDHDAHSVSEGLRLLISYPIMMCMLFYVMLTIGFTGVRSFIVVALNQLYGMSEILGNTILTGFMAGSAVGVLVGGFVADRYGPRIATAFATLVSAGVMLVIVGSYDLPVAVILLAITLSGILQGVLLPSRDLLIRAVTPQGSMGKVLGFLTTGMMLAAAAVQPMFGWLMDIQEPRWVFWLSAIFVVGGLFCFAGASSTNGEKQPA
ncbi:MFS transporter [Alphaproteobacteria bacterium]|nr:MFS transporter [Alphaproteobacteria bacterium]